MTPPQAPATRGRRRQADRSRASRKAILDVTLDAIHARGLSGTSTNDVTRLAGVSRGALLHHFPTRVILLQEALRYLLVTETTAIERLAEQVETGEVDFQTFLETLWEHFSGRMFMITLEFLAAARTDAAIRETLTTVALEFNASLDGIWERMELMSSRTVREQRLALNTTLCMLRGMGTQSVWRDDPQLFRDMLDFWRRTLEDAGLLRVTVIPQK